MRSRIFLFSLLSISVASHAQSDTTFFGEVNYLKGYIKTVNGQLISYQSALPDVATEAILTRCTNGEMSIEWESESLPAMGNDVHVYFAQLIAHAQRTQQADAYFDFYINNQKKLVISLLKGKTGASWHFASPDGAEVAFERTFIDGVYDAHGYLYVKVPRVLCRTGEPLQFKIVGQSLNTRDWLMTFTYELGENISVTPLSLITKDGLMPVHVQAVHFGKSDSLKLLIDNQHKYNFLLNEGLNKFEIFLTPVHARKTLTGSAVVGQRYRREFSLTLEPVTPRTIHLIHHSHYDVGYSHIQPEVERIHTENLSQSLRQISQTKHLPVESRFRYNAESAFAIENFLRVCSDEQEQQLMQAVKEGYISIGANYANLLTGISHPETLFKFNTFVQELKETYGISCPTAMISDIPGLVWAALPAMARNGVRYISSGPNYTGALPFEGDRIGFSSVKWKDRPFWWLSPSGKERVLFWLAGKGYSSWHGTKPGELAQLAPKRVSAYMNELTAANYPYEMVQWRYNVVQDNGPIDTLLAQHVAAWNQEYAQPKIVVNTVDAMFREFESRYGNQLPQVAGDFTPYWEDGAYSTTREMILSNRNAAKLVSLSTFYALPDNHWVGQEAQEETFRAAWKNLLLWTEHTWGASNSISEPDAPGVLYQWNFKKQYAAALDSCVQLLAQPLQVDVATNPVAFDLVNTLSFPRSELVYFDAALVKMGRALYDSKQERLPQQRLADGRVAVWIKNVPPLGAQRVFVKRDKRPVSAAANNNMFNEELDWRLNTRTGSIQWLQWKRTGQNLVDTAHYSGINEWRYVTGTNPVNSEANRSATLKATDAGEVIKKYVITSEIEGCHSVESEITFSRFDSRIFILNRIDKKAVRTKESLHIAFPFALKNGKQRFNTGWGGIFGPAENQLAGSNQDFYSVQQWCDISTDKVGVTLLLADVNLIEPGGMIDETLDRFGYKVWKKEPDLSPVWFSYLMNNYWHTNYKADQEGKVEVSYTLLPHGPFMLAETQRQGLAHQHPLLLMPAHGSIPLSSWLTLSNNDVVISMIEKTTAGYKMKLFNTSDQEQQVFIRWYHHKPEWIKVTDAPLHTFQQTSDKAVILVKFQIAEIEWASDPAPSAVPKR